MSDATLPAGVTRRPRFASRARWRLGAAVAVIVMTIATWGLTVPRTAVSREGEFPDGDVARGRLIFDAGDCASCHASPGQADRLQLGGGLALASPYGTLYAPNISSDPDDGIGRWKTADLVNALKSGVSPGGHHYYPVLPYASYAHMRDGDVVDLGAYLRTLPAVRGHPPPHDLAPPFNVRRLVGLWKLLYLDRSPIAIDPARSASWNRGRYLVESVTHCAECHSSRDVFGGIRESTRYAGGADPKQTGFTPNITAAGLAAWSDDDVFRLLTDGRTPDGRVAGSSMADVVANTARLPESDRRAIAVYVKSLAAVATPPP